jgi:hypothetical protein
MIWVKHYIIFLGRVSEQFQLIVIIGFGGKIVFVIWVDFVANMDLVCEPVSVEYDNCFVI